VFGLGGGLGLGRPTGPGGQPEKKEGNSGVFNLISEMTIAGNELT
jgi:hypothetical protein